MKNTLSFPVQILFQNLSPSLAVESNILAHIIKLERFYDHIMNCHVLVSINNRRPNQGKLFNVCLDLALPTTNLVVSKASNQNHAHEDIFVSIRDAFKALQRQLQNFVGKQRGHIKHHETPAHGRVSRLASHATYGFIETPDGRNIHFTNNSLVNGQFKKLKLGAPVRFVEAANDLGTTSASTVRIIGKHHVA